MDFPSLTFPVFKAIKSVIYANRISFSFLFLKKFFYKYNALMR